MLKKLFLYSLLSLTLITTLTVFAGQELIFAVTLIRHGDRSPYAAMDSTVIKYKWPQGIGQLTPEGMNQEYNLGKELREKYIKTYRLLPESYNVEKMYVLSTNYDRTLMSAESLLTGFYPPGTGPDLENGSPALPGSLQPIPIHITPKGEMNIINPEISNAKEFDALLSKYAYTQKAWIDQQKKLSKDFKRWGEILGVKIDNLNEFLIPSDNVNCMYIHHIPFPKELTKEDIEQIIKNKMSACAIRFVPKEIAKFMATPFMTKLKTDMNMAVNNDATRFNYILYSGHDDSILGIMSALNVPLANNPPYASHVDFELYKDNNDYLVKVLYNGKVLQLSGVNSDGYSSLEDFYKLIAPYTEVK